MSVPDYQTLMLPVLKFASSGEVSVRACVERLAQDFGLTEDEKSELLPSGKKPRFANRVHWAKTHLAQAGLISATKRGYFTITSSGSEVLKSGVSRIDNAFLSQFPSFLAFKSRSTAEASGSAALPAEASANVFGPENTPQEVIEQAHREIEKELRDLLLQEILNSNPSFFENLIIDLLIAMGYGGSRAEAGKQLGRSGDGGIDGVINEDILGLDVIYLQAKRYGQDNIVGESDIRGFAGALLNRGATKGVFVTTSSFSRQAIEFSERMRHQRLILIDGDQLTQLMIKHGIGVRTTHVVEIKKIDQEYFDDLE